MDFNNPELAIIVFKPLYKHAEVGDKPELHVTYGSLRIENGQVLNPDDLLNEPDVSIAAKDGTYTLMMVDPDAPKPTTPKYRSWLHWLVINIPGVDPSRGEEVIGYVPPEPAEGRHRYLYLLFKQSGRVTARQPAKRQGFQVREWAKEHDLGNPVNGLFFWSAADSTQG